jgi:ADP-heptose:LPS heptosyltransferase/GT2 family glycosyltransferase
MKPSTPRRGRRATPDDDPRGREVAFVLSCVDQPRPGERVQAGAILSGKGWAISESPIASIAVHLGEAFLCYANYGQPRPEIGRDFGHYPQAHHAGFIFSVRLGDALEQERSTDLQFRFRCENGHESRRHVALAWPSEAAREIEHDATSRPWPIRLALEECRIDGAGRLLLRGWAIGRKGIDTLALFLNDTRLHAPELGLARPEIAQRHPAYPGAALSGFRLVQTLDRPAQARDSVRVIARSGEIQRQIIVPVNLPSTQRRMLQAGAVSLCCETVQVTPGGALVIAGWAVGEAETRQIEVVAGEVSVGFAEVGFPRPDIGNRFPQLPAARHAGFRFSEHMPVGVAGALTMIVRDSAGGERRMRLDIPDGAGTDGTAFSEAETEAIHFGIDSPALFDGRATAPVCGRFAVGGWTVCAGGIERVEIWCDERLLGPAFVGVRREDIAAAFPDYPGALTSGFAFSMPHRLIGDGEHAIRVVVRARSGAMTEEIFRVVLETDDDRGIGMIRDHVPFSETLLRRELLAAMGVRPRVTVLIRRSGTGEARGLAASLDSLRRQSLSDWCALVLAHDEDERVAAEAVIAAEPRLAGRAHAVLAAANRPLWPDDSGGWADLLCVLRVGDRFGADAFMEFAIESALSGAEFVYADERCFDAARESVRPFFKPGWSPDLLLSTNYIGRAWCCTRGLAQRTRFSARALEQRGEYDAVLVMTQAARGIAHLPLSLAERVGRRIEPAAREQDALRRAAKRRGIEATVVPGQAPASWRLQRTVAADQLVSIIIPTCGARGLIRTAITTLRAVTVYRNCEIVVLDGIGSDQPDLKAWVTASADRILPIQGAFNWSAANNLGARAARGALLLFLNDDVECRDPDWLAALVEHAQRPEVGAVGPQLQYPDGKVQHAGMFLRGGEGIHAFRFAAADDPGPFGLALTQRDVTAVTGACMMVRREVFESLGGFDEAHCVIKNDLDFCLRLGAAGKRVIYTPHAQLIHHEMASRAALADSFDAPRFDGAWALNSLRGDGFTSPNLLAESDDFAADAEPVQILQPRKPMLDRESVRHILVVKLDHIGDFVAAIPAIKRLRIGFPHARISLLGSSAAVALARLVPEIDELIPFDFFSTKSASGRRTIDDEEIAALVGDLRKRQIDLAVDLRIHPDTRHMLRYAGATWYAGYDHGGRFPWLDITLEWEGDLRLAAKRTHLSESLLRLAAAIDAAARAVAMPLKLTRAPELMPRLLRAASAPAGFGARRLVCIHPGAGTSLKQWPVAAFAGLIRLLLAAHDVSILLIGSADETRLAADLAAAVGRPDRLVCVAGMVDLADLPSVLSGCALFVGNDSGPKHIAGALGVPTVGVHAHHVDAAEWSALGPRAVAVQRRMNCGPCYLADENDCPRGVACLRAITPAQVYRACRLLLGFAFGAADAAGIAIGAAAAD